MLFLRVSLFSILFIALSFLKATAAGSYDVWAMGDNSSGQFGDGTTTNRSTPVQVASGVAKVAAGETHSLYLKPDGTLWATGANWYGQLGDGTTTSRSTPVPGVGVEPTRLSSEDFESRYASGRDRVIGSQ